jgi:hypothetical protein
MMLAAEGGDGPGLAAEDGPWRTGGISSHTFHQREN